ncbi:MAG: 30S ribosomal protein S1 [candidate division WOR-3 bacterium]
MAEERLMRDAEFEELLQKSISVPKEGDVVKGVIVKVTPQEVFIDIGTKSEGVCPRVEFKDPDIKPGDEVYVYVDAIDGKDGKTIVSKHKADFLMVWDRINDAFKNDEIIDAKVVRQTKGGLMVEVFGVDAFLPGSQIDVKKVKSISAFVGKTIKVKIIKLNRQRKNIVVSRKEVIEAELESQRMKLMSMKVGDVVEGVVKNVTDFGVFVDVGGVDGLIHISDLSWTKVDDPSSILKPGDQVKVKVLDIDPENNRLSLGYKHLQPHPFEQVAKKYPIGSLHKGTVKKILDFGVIVELEPGIEGLVHITEMRWGKPPVHPSEMVKEGDKVDVVVLNVEVEKQRISLGMKQATPDPWSLIDEKYAEGTIVRGTIKDFDSQGAFIELEDGIQGYLHVGDISWTKKYKSPEEALRKGQKLRFKVLSTDKRGRMVILSLKHMRPNPWEEIEKTLLPGTDIKAPITEITDRGIYVEIQGALEGFVPANQLYRKGNPAEQYKVGEELNLKVFRVEAAKKRITLSEREYYRAIEKAEAQQRHAAEKQAEEATILKSEPVRINLGEILRQELQKLEELKNIMEEPEE